jgi:hypothetical protein
MEDGGGKYPKYLSCSCCATVAIIVVEIIFLINLLQRLNTGCKVEFTCKSSNCFQVDLLFSSFSSNAQQYYRKKGT